MSETFCPWEQLAEENGDEWTAFVAYRDQGPQRSLMEASRKAGCSKNSVTKWSRAYTWEARVRAWDAEVDRIRRHRFLAEQRKLIKLHSEAAREVREKAMEAIRLTHPEDLIEDPRVAIAWLKFATELEAKSCGLPTEVTALSLSGGQAKPAEDVYFDSLPDDRLVDIVQMSLATLQKDKRAPDDAAESERSEHRDLAGQGNAAARDAGEGAV